MTRPMRPRRVRDAHKRQHWNRACGFDGRFRQLSILNVAIGEYQVSASQDGFKTAVSETFPVVVGARQRADLSLEVGSTSDRQRPAAR
ncbi:MAG: carboxypeptidase-like regulatory domain-containing protein [Bryobacterales bacterium]